MRKKIMSSLIFSECSFVQLTNMKASAQRIYQDTHMTHSFNSAAYRSGISHKHGKVGEQIGEFRTSMFEHSHI